MAFKLSDLPIKSGHLFIGLAVFMGLLTIVLFNSARQDVPKKKQIVQTVETQKILVPSVPIMQGEVVSRDDITLVDWPAAMLPKYSVFTKPHELVGRTAKQNLLPGEPIFKQKIASKDASGMPALIPPGYRAVTVSVTEIKGVAGFIKPGDRVDVLSTFEVENQNSERKFQLTRTLLQNALVLASAQGMVNEDEPKVDTPEGVERGGVQIKEEEADQKKDKKKEDRKKELSQKEKDKERKAREKERREVEKRAKLVSSITLALSPSDAEKVALAEETGSLRLVLRSNSDYTVEPLDGVEFGQLIGIMDVPPAPKETMPPAPPISDFAAIPPTGKNQVEVIEGTEKSSVYF